MKLTNKYAKEFPNFEQTPKAVIAALAMSLALRLSERDFYKSKKLLVDEWRLLNELGIIPQRPRGVAP